ncbi:AraD1 family protein [uncultured Paludibaculum sp.]|uniref:AraD1 family protein n=1 Tax=uncultured Paludibaculum sp. TaxID=1765020 RepID=UPI002AAB2EC0|nr:AraD1 family protein [uncultured Paludibaculum sp.]
MLRVIQITHPVLGRHVGLVSQDTVSILDGPSTVYATAQTAFAAGRPLAEFLRALPVESTVPYDDLYLGRTPWRVLLPFDHPSEPARCLVSGTGLTHLASAETRQKMHAAVEQETDSMRMYRWGVEGGRPPAGQIGTAPEWFYKGSGLILRAHGDPLEVPAYARDGGEEPEIAGVYLIDDAGAPRRIGMTIGNEFSDHKTERLNYLYLAPSKLRQCSIGPELIVDPDFTFVPGVVSIERSGETIWSKQIGSGEQRMAHTLANMEHHHFKYEQHRRPGDVHVHFYGADAFSFGAGLELQGGDIMQVSFEGFGRPLRNPLHVSEGPESLVTVLPA